MYPFWRYYGGKWRLAPRYPKPLHDTVIEPFAGAAGYSVRHAHKRVILIERYAVIAEIWRFLIGASQREIMATPLVDHVDDLPKTTAQGLRHLIGFHMNAATVSPCVSLSSGRKNLREMGRIYEGWTEATRARVAQQVEQIRHWTVIEGDYTAAPDIAATWFIDPPYEVGGEHYKHDSGALDFAALAAWAQSRSGQVIVCEAQGAKWLPFEPFARAKASPMSRKGGIVEEAIYYQVDGVQKQVYTQTSFAWS